VTGVYRAAPAPNRCVITKVGSDASHLRLLGHLQRVVYLGIEIDDALEMAEQTEV